jgi:hypothetical protein
LIAELTEITENLLVIALYGDKLLTQVHPIPAPTRAPFARRFPAHERPAFWIEIAGNFGAFFVGMPRDVANGIFASWLQPPQLPIAIQPPLSTKKKSRDKGVTALEGDLRKALGRSFLRWEKDKT